MKKTKKNLIVISVLLFGISKFLFAQPSIGDSYAGGIVFYIDGSGNGFVCAESDQSSVAQWGCSGLNISGADGIVIGTGAQRAEEIMKIFSPVFEKTRAA